MALALMAIILPAASGLTSAAAQDVQKNSDVNEFRISHIASTDEASKFALRFSDAQIKEPTLKIYNELGDVIYSAPIARDYTVFNVLTEEPSATLTFALFDGKKKLTSRTWQIAAKSETKVTATQSR